MMQLPIMINEKTIGAITIRRLEPLKVGQDAYRYEWEVTVGAFKDKPGGHASGTIAHYYSLGALSLARAVLNTPEVKRLCGSQ